MGGFWQKRHPSWHKIRRTEEIRVDFSRSWGGNRLETLNPLEHTRGWKCQQNCQWRIDLGTLGYSWSSSNLIICRSSFRSSFGEDWVTGLGPSSEHPKIVAISSVWDCQVQIFLMLLGVKLGLYFAATTMTIIPIRWEIWRMLVRRCFPDNFLVSIFSIYLGFAVPHLGQNHISSHILFGSLIVMTLAAKGNHPKISFISGWWMTIYQPNGGDSFHCSSIGPQVFLRNNRVFGVNNHIWLMVHTPWFIWEWLKMNNPSKKLDSFRSKRDRPKQCPKSKVAKTVPCLKLGWSAPCRA